MFLLLKEGKLRRISISMCEIFFRITQGEKTRKGQKCGLIHVYGDGSYEDDGYSNDSFKVFSEKCDLIVGHMHAFCEFEI